MGLFSEIMLCMFAVFGLWCLLHLVIDTWLGSREIGRVIIVCRASAVRNLPQLLEEVKRIPFGRRREPLIVLYDRSLCGESGMPPDSICAMIARAGGVWYVTDTLKRHMI